MAPGFSPTRVDTLPNGMRVLTRELHHAPVATVMVWYGVGSRNEQPGSTGHSHFLEHMMFKGTERFPYGALEEGVKRRGGMWNAFTSYDYTSYYEVLPARHLEYGLELEADRMVNMSFDPDLTVKERGIIVSEREGRENSPYFWLFEAFMQEAYRTFPYRHQVLGYKDDIKATTAEALTEHYRRYYRPKNAALVVTGDFATEKLLELATTHFGHLQRGADVALVEAVEPNQDGERRVVVNRPGPNPQLIGGYKIPGADHPDHAALTILAAVLAGGPSFSLMGSGAVMGRSSRLYRRLVNKGIATSASGYPWSLQYPGLFVVSGTPVPGTSLEKLDAALFAEVEILRQERVESDEFDRAQKQVRAQFIYGLESAINQAVMVGSTALTSGVEHFDRALEEFASVTPDDVLRVAQTYLSPERRTVGWFVPADQESGRLTVAVKPATAEAGSNGTTPEFQKPGNADAQPPVGERRGRIMDVEQVVRHLLPGGATLLVYRAESIPSVVVRVQMEAGAVHDSAAKAGRAQLAAQLLTRGSKALSADELAVKTDALGMSIRSDIGRETAVVSLKCLPEDLETGVDLLAEVVQRPTFPDDELARMRDRMLVTVRESNNDTRSVASRRLAQVMYPEGHPYASPANGTEESLKALTQADVKSFHADHFGPRQAIITVVGNVDPERVEGALVRAFEGWSGGKGQLAIPDAPLPEASRQHVDVPGKTQTDIALGWPMVPRSHPDFLALDFLATLFGGNGTPASSRLFRDVREKYGLSYYQFASFHAPTGPGSWAAHIGVNPSRLDFAVEIVTQELERLRSEPVPQPEMEALKQFLEDYPALQHESLDRVAGYLAEVERYGLGLDYIDRHPVLVRALTAEHLQEVAARHLQLDRLSVVTAGSEAETKAEA